MSEENRIREFTIWWNNTFVLDYWYRKKYNIPFNSKQHRKIEPFSIAFEWEEDQLGTIIRNQEIRRKREEDYKKTGNWLMPREQKLDDSFYENLDDNFFEQFDDKE